MKKLSYRTITVIYISILYFIFSGIVFFIYSNYYIGTMKKEFVEENRFAAKVASDIISDEKIKLAVGARMAASDDMVYYALKSNIYLENKAEIGNGTLTIKTKEIAGIDYKNLVNIIRNKIYGTGRGSEEIGAEIFNSEFKRVSYSSYFPKKFLDNGDEPYIRDSFGDLNLGGVEITLIERRGNEFVMKGIAPVGKNTRYLYEKPYGAVVVGKVFDGVFLEKIKKTVNRELFLYTNDMIVKSTLFDGAERLENIEVSITYAKGDEEFFFSEMYILGKKMGITFFPIKNYNGETIAFLGAGSSYENMEKTYHEGIIQFIKYEAVITIAMILLLLIILRRISKPFYRLLNRIKEIREGRYDKKIYMRREREELQLMIDSINSLADAVKKREASLVSLNMELEDKVLARTRELYDKNKQLEKLIAEINKVNRRVNEEIETARKIHDKISAFRNLEMEKFTLRHQNISITGIGGDFIETIITENGKKGIFFADVAGHGVAAALMVSALKIIISIYFPKFESPDEAMYLLNDIINDNFIEGITLSAVYIIINRDEDAVQVCAASQEEVYVLKENRVEVLEHKGIILGVLTSEEIRNMESVAYKTVELNMMKNDKIFLYTDGLIEKGIIDRNELKVILQSLISKNSIEIIDFMKSEINPKIVKIEKDDVTYLVLEKSC